jgi:hypothetical protein
MSDFLSSAKKRLIVQLLEEDEEDDIIIMSCFFFRKKGLKLTKFTRRDYKRAVFNIKERGSAPPRQVKKG